MALHNIPVVPKVEMLGFKGHEYVKLASTETSSYFYRGG